MERLLTCDASAKAKQCSSEIQWLLKYNDLESRLTVQDNNVRRCYEEITKSSQFSIFPDVHNQTFKLKGQRYMYFYLTKKAVMGLAVTTSLCFNGNLRLLDGSPRQQEVITE